LQVTLMERLREQKRLSVTTTLMVWTPALLQL
jgi:hypothetical protein